MNSKTTFYLPGLFSFSSDLQLKLHAMGAKEVVEPLKRLREPTILLGNNPSEVEAILDVPPWGTYLPAENIYSDAYIAMQIETADLPAGARVSVQWRATDGSSYHISTEPIAISWPEVLHIVIPNEKLHSFEGRQVSVTYTVHLDDGSITYLPPRSVNVTKRLVYSPPVIEGVTEEGLDVSAYPNGLKVNLAAIGNGQPYQKINCSWGIYRVIDGWLVSLYDLQQAIEYGSGINYEYSIPSEAYTGFPEDAFCMCLCSLRLVPYPSIFGWGLGGSAFSLITGNQSIKD